MQQMNEPVETRRETIAWLYRAGEQALSDLQAQFALQLEETCHAEETATRWRKRHETLRQQLGAVLTRDAEEA